MYRNSAKRLSAFVVSMAAAFLILFSSALVAAQQKTPGKVVKPRLAPVLKVGVSKPLRDMKPSSPNPHGAALREIELRSHPPLGSNAPKPHDPLVQKTQGKGLIPSGPSFDGVNDRDGVQPADTTMDVSDTQILQWVNLSYEVLDKSGNLQAGPFEGNAFWAGLGGNCDAPFNGGDILVRWDQFASRWVVAQLSYQGSSFDLCVAASQTSDATGAYFQYDFFYSNTDINDYPKLGMWPDTTNNGYYFTARNFAGGSSFTGMTIQALDRAAVLAGTATGSQIFDVGSLNPNIDGLLPMDLRGTSTPPNGSLETYIGVGSPGTDGNPTSVIHLFQTFVDFSNPGNSTLTQLTDIPVADFDNSLTGAPQVGGGNLEVISGFGQSGVLYRADYRVFPDHDSLLMYHDVNVVSSCNQGEQGGFRWHEVRGIAVAGPPSQFQEGTYGPCDGTYRWMGSIAQDFSGDIAVGFSASSGGGGIVIDPSVHYTGRLVTDPPGEMGQGEGTFFDSTQPFGGFRWGDYSTMIVDPVDQCTFWYTTMYGAGDWNTRIGNFKFPSCTIGPSGTLEGTVTDGTNPIANASVTANLASTLTNAAGHYQFSLPVGTYDMTATKFGYTGDSATGVAVTDGGDTIQDFVLTPNLILTVNGTVKDGSGAQWPLYSKIYITGPPGFLPVTLYTDPVSGYYSLPLPAGFTYHFQVTSQIPGYNVLNQDVFVPIPGIPTDPPGFVANFLLTVDAAACNAPGYSSGTPTPLFGEAFDGGVLPPGWSVINNTGNGRGWNIQVDPSPCSEFSGNPTGGTGAFALVNSDCDGLVLLDEELRTPSIDVSGFGGAILTFNQDYFNLGDTADVDMSTDGGATWNNILRQTTSDRGPAFVSANITGAGGQSNVQLRFHYYNAFFAWWWAVDNINVAGANCLPGSGGLVVGNVSDANTGSGLNGATVMNLPDGASTTSFATPGDPNVPDGFYAVFSGSGPQPFEASLTGYTSQTKSTAVIPNSTVRLDFSLGAGLLTVSPTSLSSKVDPGATDLQTLTISNSGSGDGAFKIVEVNAPLPPVTHVHPMASLEDRRNAQKRVPVARLNSLNANQLPAMPKAPKNVPQLNTGDVISSFPSNLSIGWGVGFDGNTSRVWISNPSYIGGGDNKNHSFTTSGSDTGDTIDLGTSGGLWAGDEAFNSRTGMLWGVNVGGDNCLFEMNPITKVVTGNEICGSPWTNISQRGVAYDAAADTYFVGGWNEGTIYHIDGTGAVLDSAFVALSISGLAYDSASHHLLVMQNQPAGNDITVLDAANGYAVLGAFQVLDNGSPAFGSFQQAGLEFDCSGNLWAINQATQVVYLFQGGEPAACGSDIPWLSEDPTEGTVPAGGSVPIAVTFDSAGLLPGLRQAQLTFTTDTPYTVPALGVNFTVRFLDVLDNNPPGTDPFENFIYAAAGANIMHGCSFFNFCPSALVTRADMAGYIWRSVHGAFAAPPAYTGIFSDVFFNDFNADYIQGVWDDGITAGCQGPGQPLAFCPSQSIPRAQMAVFIEKGVRGSAFVPPACTQPPIFGDVPCPATPDFPYSDWVELLFNDGITSGCSVAPPLFCPLQPIPNEQMAVFIVKAFGFPVLP